MSSFFSGAVEILYFSGKDVSAPLEKIGPYAYATAQSQLNHSSYTAAVAAGAAGVDEFH